jgi:hypothetical protein
VRGPIVLGLFVLVLAGATLLFLTVAKIGQKMFQKKDKESK